MASKWYYAKDGQQLGPVNSADLKELAACGSLKPNDLIWMEGLAKWAPASSLKGLFSSTGTNPHSEPPPLPPLPPKREPTNTTSVLEALKTAGNLTINHAERTRLVTVSLTAAYHRLGKSIFVSNVGREIFGQQFSTLDALEKQVAMPSPVTDTTPDPQGFMQKATAMAKSTTETAQRKVAKARLDHALTSLGKAAYEQRTQLSLPDVDIAAIDELFLKVSNVDAEIKQLSSQKPAFSLLENRIIQGTLAVLCFPIGLFLIWRSNQWSKPAKVAWSGGIALVLLAAALSPKDKQDVMPLDGNGASSSRSANGDPHVSIELVLQLQPGMSEDQVKAILGAPHEVKEFQIPPVLALNQADYSQVNWTYNPDTNDWIGLLFEHGILIDGGTGGYNLKSGIKLPPEATKIFDGAK